MSEAKQAAADRVLAFQIAASDKTASVTVIRDEGFIDWMLPSLHDFMWNLARYYFVQEETLKEEGYVVFR